MAGVTLLDGGVSAGTSGSEPARALATVQQPADRTLLARLGYTRVQRGMGPLKTGIEARRSVCWFSYEVFGLRFGLNEGVVLGGRDELSFDWLQALGESTDATLFKLIRSVPEPVPYDEPQTQTGRGWTVTRRAARAREVLPLGATYEAMLGGLGRHTRRNIRAARKAAAGNGFGFEVSTNAPLLTASARAALAAKTRPRNTREPLISRLEAYADRTARPFRSVVRDGDGRLISYACGYFGDPAAAYLLYQLNDQALNAIGPSLLHRAYLMEWLIGRGCTEFVFVHGCSGILHHACVRQPLEEIWLMRRSAAAYLTAGLIGIFKPKASIGQLARLALAGVFR